MWTKLEQDAFESLKSAIKNAPILSHPIRELDLMVATDASDHGLGAVLFQVIQDNDIRYIEFASRALSPGERNYSATKLELSAVIFALDRFECFLLQRPFTLYTDHSALIALFKTKFNYQILTNEWYEKIVKYIDTMKIVHCPGIDNVLPDLLSRSFKVDIHNENEQKSVKQIHDLSPSLLVATAEELSHKKIRAVALNKEIVSLKDSLFLKNWLQQPNRLVI